MFVMVRVFVSEHEFDRCSEHRTAADEIDGTYNFLSVEWACEWETVADSFQLHLSTAEIVFSNAARV